MPFASSVRFGLGIQASYHNPLFKTMTPDTFVSPTHPVSPAQDLLRHPAGGFISLSTSRSVPMAISILME